MKYNYLGKTGLLVSELCLGTMTFGGKGYWENMGKVQQDEVDQLLNQALKAGVNFIDTANVYSYGESESLLGNGLKNLGINRNEVVIATKVRGRMGQGVNNVGLSRYHILQSLQASLERLQIDHVDILYVHGVDPFTDIMEIMKTLNEVVVAGKVRYLGVCNWPAWMVMKAQGICQQYGWHAFSALQYYYSLAGRDIEREILPMAMDQSLALMPWSPLAGGLLSGKFTRENQSVEGARRQTFDFPPVDKEKAYAIIDLLVRVANTHNVSAAEVALAWVRLQKGVTSTIIGAKKQEQLNDNLHSVDLILNEKELRELNDLSALKAEYPGWMVLRQSSDRIVA